MNGVFQEIAVILYAIVIGVIPASIGICTESIKKCFLSLIANVVVLACVFNAFS
ncbi:hypothetical protein [Escherichia phage FL15]